jgi:hypothetical protein
MARLYCVLLPQNFEQPFAARFDPLGAFYNFHRDDKERHSVAGINIARP